MVDTEHVGETLCGIVADISEVVGVYMDRKRPLYLEILPTIQPY